MYCLLNDTFGIEKFINTTNFDLKDIVSLTASNYPAIQILSLKVLKQVWIKLHISYLINIEIKIINQKQTGILFPKYDSFKNIRTSRVAVKLWSMSNVIPQKYIDFQSGSRPIGKRSVDQPKRREVNNFSSDFFSLGIEIYWMVAVAGLARRGHVLSSSATESVFIFVQLFKILVL